MARWWHAGQILAIAATESGDPVNVFILPATPGGEPHVLPMPDADAQWVNWAEVVADARDRPCWVGVRARDGALFCQGVRQDQLPDRHHGLVVGYPYTLLTTTESEWLFYRVAATGVVYPTWRYRRPPGSNEYDTDGSTIVFGNLDRVWRDTFDRILDVTVTPWGRERLPLLRWDLSLPWVWTVSDRPDGTPLILGREPGDRRAIVIEGIAAKTFDVAFDEDAQIWRIAAYSDHEGHGRPGLVVCSVPVDAPRETLVAPPAPPPPVEQWEPMAEPVSLWPLFVGAGPNQYPRRNPDDAGVYWDVHRANLGDGIEHAWFVKTLDGRVYEWRAVLPDETGRLWLCLLEDHDEHGRTYQFEDPRLCPMVVRAGEVYERVTQLREWDRAREAWGPWTGPGADGRFRFRVHVVSVERSNYGRRRAVLAVDTYQDLEIFELYSNKGWSAWEEWRASAATTSSRTRTLLDGRRVGFVKRVEWPERFDGPRVWPVRPFGEWPRDAASLPPPSPVETTRVTIEDPVTWPVESTAPATLRCVAYIRGQARTITWTRRDATGAVVERVTNPAWDLDHTFRAPSPGVWWIQASVERAGIVLDQTMRERKWIVHPAPPVEPPPGPPPDATWRPTRDEVLRWRGDFLDALNGFQHPTFMLPGMPVDLQDAVLARYPGRHVPFAWKTWYPRFPQWGFDRPHDIEDVIDRCFAHHCIPVLFVPIEAGDSLDAHIARITPVLTRLRDGGRLVALCWGWEINDINGWTANGTQQLEYLRRLRAIVPAPIPLYAHWTPERWSGWPSFDGTEPEKGELDWLREAERIGLTGVLYQEPWDKPVAEIEDRAFRYDQKNYIGPGIKGRVETAGLQFVLFEHSRDPEHYRAVVALCERYGAGYC
jgi:hypothetical protein